MPASLKRIAERALSNVYTLSASYQMARSVVEENIPGDLVECGVFAGAQVAAMASALMNSGCTNRKVHLFDSFCGIPKAGPFDRDIAELVGMASERGIESSGVSVCSMDQVRQHMEEWGIPAHMLVYHPGWFHDTVPIAELPAISLLRLDGDLYDSTKVCLSHLLPKVSRGGWVIVDDYGLDGCRRAVHEQMPAVPIYWRAQ